MSQRYGPPDAHFRRALLRMCFETGRVLVIRLARLGMYHAATADAHYNLGLLYRLHGDAHEACREFQFARDARREVAGAVSLGVAEVDVSLGFTEHQLGNLDEAHARYASAFHTRKRLRGDAHPDTAEALTLLDALRAEDERASAPFRKRWAQRAAHARLMAAKDAEIKRLEAQLAEMRGR